MNEASRKPVDAPDKDAEKDAAAAIAAAPSADSDLVDWDGPNDPENPRNWSQSLKTAHVALLSLSVLYANLATTMFAPGAAFMQRDFGFTSSTVEVLTITIASLGFAIGQLFAGPLSEVFGRSPIYRVSSILYMGFTAGCARSTHIAEFLVFRWCTGFSAASYMSTGGGTIADLLPKEKRGGAMALYTAGPVLGPVIGPIIGGFVTQDLSWRWCFYLILMLSGVINLAAFFVMRETSSLVLLKRKAARLRKETGNENLRAVGDMQLPARVLILNALYRPVRLLVLSPIVGLTAIYLGFVFGVVMLLYATFPEVFENTYGWSVGVSGLAYIGLGIGSVFGMFLFAKFSDRLLHTKNGTIYRPEQRLILMMWVAPVVPVGMFLYGWAAKYKLHWIVPIIGTTIAAPGGIIITSGSQIYMIDVFGPQAAASALAAVTLLRNLMGCFLPLAAPALYDNLGLGWGNSVLAFITLAFVPVPFLFYKWGEWLRESFPVKI
ncbi:putative MFS transporter [Cryphonectria parasitica EP155]|uniref:MFS transporter n=1 Tax=Cryphonectria parasitica (strain ATCC 38755 / EP155) TaxID=660469 RepID=A0A9P4XXX8_CRYP1|nr:putative MFS transporter [Cryphonectria parasitica EP155]KAF3762959.1 putative MFS transporter [Cryphonectria parasitica EP155]